SELYELAAEKLPGDRSKLLVEFAEQLLKAGRPKDTLAIFDRLPIEELDTSSLQAFAVALLHNGSYTRARALLMNLTQRGDLPQWATDLSLELAYRTEDPTLVVEQLTAIVAHSPSTVRRLELAATLIELDLGDDAIVHLDILRNDISLEPVQQMAL